MKLIVKHSGREIELECDLPQNYTGHVDSEKRKEAHVRHILDIVKETVEQIIKMNQ